MRYRTTRSSINKRRSFDNNDIVDTESGGETRLIYPYDGEFFERYGDFVSELELMIQNQLGSSYDLGQLHPIVDIGTHINIMVREESGQTDLTEYMMDLVFETIPDCASDALEIITEYHNTSPRPYGFEVLRSMEAANESIQVMELESLREENTMIYTVMCLG